MIDLRNIHALDHFKRNSAEFRERLKKTGEPEVLTVDGKAELVVQSAEAYQKLLDRLEDSEALAAIRAGLADEEAGRLHDATEVHAELRRNFGLPPRRSTPAKRRRGA